MIFGAKQLLFVALTIILLATAVLMKDAKSNELPKVPPFSKMLYWKPQPDRTMEVGFPGVAFRYSILDWKPAPRCAAVIELVRTPEIRWVTHAGVHAQQYLTSNSPMLFKKEGESEWHWVNLRTYKEK